MTVANQLGAVARSPRYHRAPRRRFIAATVAFDLGVLGVFKYYGFFANEIGAFLDDIGLPMPLPLLTLALPIGAELHHLPGHLVLR